MIFRPVRDSACRVAAPCKIWLQDQRALSPHDLCCVMLQAHWRAHSARRLFRQDRVAQGNPSQLRTIQLRGPLSTTTAIMQR